MISQRKFDNLTRGLRGGLTEEAKQGFIHRQLVETRQITKHVARILHQRFNQENMPEVNIISLKSRMVSTFRKSFGLYKVRDINDYHHAHDAYLNAVVSLSVLKVYPQISRDLIYGQFGKHQRVKGAQATKEFYLYKNILKFFDKENVIVESTGEVLWNQATVIPRVKKVLYKSQINFVKKAEVQRGEFYKASIVSKSDSDVLIPRKKGWDTKKYGGLMYPKVAYSLAVKYINGKGKETSEFIGVKITEQEKFEKNPNSFFKSHGITNILGYLKVVKYDLIEFSDGRRRLLASDKELQKANQLMLSEEWTKMVYHLKQCSETGNVDSKRHVESNLDKLDDIFEYLLEFVDKKIKLPKASEELKKAYNKRNKICDISTLSESMMGILLFCHRGAFPVKFKFFGENVGQKRYIGLSSCWQGVLIYQSITGLYETRVKLEDLSSWDGAQL